MCAQLPFQTPLQASQGSETLIDLGSMPHAARIDLQPEAVADRVPDRPLPLLDEPFCTPHQRFALPPDASTSSLASSAGLGVQIQRTTFAS